MITVLLFIIAEIGKRKGCWRVEGLISLLPIYEELEDGAELIWNEYENISVKKVKSWIRKKEELETFDDN
ncbi:MAG: hypothetical protein ACC651_14370 [Candidatus Scalindua sp.]